MAKRVAIWVENVAVARQENTRTALNSKLMALPNLWKWIRFISLRFLLVATHMPRDRVFSMNIHKLDGIAFMLLRAQRPTNQFLSPNTEQICIWWQKLWHKILQNSYNLTIFMSEIRIALDCITCNGILCVRRPFRTNIAISLVINLWQGL